MSQGLRVLVLHLLDALKSPCNWSSSKARIAILRRDSEIDLAQLCGSSRSSFAASALAMKAFLAQAGLIGGSKESELNHCSKLPKMITVATDARHSDGRARASNTGELGVVGFGTKLDPQFGDKETRRGAISSAVFLAVFFFSGSAALVYQICWQRLLGVYYGVGAISTAIIVSIFMLGLGVGSLIGGRLSESRGNAIFIYIVIEAAIGIFGLVSIPLLFAIGQSTAGVDYLWMLLVISLFLSVPTALMGMTLPIAIAIMRKINSDVLANLSMYYFINTVGAASGAVLGSYVLISFFGIDGALGTAALINILLSCAILALIKREQSLVVLATVPQDEGSSHDSYSILPLLFINGFAAVGYQIVWYRIVGVLLKDSTYAFSTTLSVYLLGIGIGSFWLHSREHNKWPATRYDHYLWLSSMIGM